MRGSKLYRNCFTQNLLKSVSERYFINNSRMRYAIINSIKFTFAVNGERAYKNTASTGNFDR